MCLTHLTNIANAYILVEHWPNYFKNSTFVIIPKPNKPLYNSSKSFRPIVLLNMISKLIKKVISN